jgi:surface protein
MIFWPIKNQNIIQMECVFEIREPNTLIQLPISNIFNLSVTWGDGTTNNQTSHTYSTIGTYTVNSTGYRWFYSTTGHWPGVTSLTRVNSWSVFRLDGAFWGASELVSVPNSLPNGVINLDNMFRDAFLFNDSNVSSWNVSAVTSMSYMFANTNKFNCDLSWNVANVKNMSYMFSFAYAFNSPSVSLWKTTNLENASGMFYGSTKFNQDISIKRTQGIITAWDTRKLINVREMFRTSSFQNGNQPLVWYIDKITDMSYMFADNNVVVLDFVFTHSGGGQPWALLSTKGMFSNTLLISDISARFSNWYLTNVTDMSYMFANSTISDTVGGNPIDLFWDTKNVVDMSYMFYNTILNVPIKLRFYVNKLITIKYMFGAPAPLFYPTITLYFVHSQSGEYNWVLEDMSYAFYNNITFNPPPPSPSWIFSNFSTWDTFRVRNMSYMFAIDENDGNLFGSFNQPLTWRVNSLENASYMFYRQISISDGYLQFYSTGGAPWVLQNISYMFYKVLIIVAPGISNWDTRNVTNMSHTFYECTTFNESLSLWNTANVTDMSFLFYGNYNFRGNLASWNVSQVTTMESMFEMTPERPNRDFNPNLNSWDVSRVTNMSRMFCYTAFQNGPDATDLIWNTQNVLTMSHMFQGNIANWTSFLVFPVIAKNIRFQTSQVTDMSYMFNDVLYISGHQLFFNTNAVTNMSHMFSFTFVIAYDIFQPFLVTNELWNTANVTNMSYLFAGRILYNTSVANIDTSSVTNMEGMFSGCSAFNQSVATFQTSQVVNISHMFENATSFQAMGGLLWDTSRVTTMESTFAGASQFQQLDISGWNLSSIQTMKHMLDNTKFSPYTYSLVLKNWYENNTILPNHIELGSQNLYYLSFIQPIHDNFVYLLQWTLTDSVLSTSLQLQLSLPSPGITIELPLQQFVPDVTLVVNWGDNTFYDSFQFTHQYAQAGEYTILVSDCFLQFGYFDISSDLLYLRYRGAPWNGVQYITSVNSFGTSLLYLDRAFYGATALQHVTPMLSPSSVTLNHMFDSATSFVDTSMNLNAWNVSRVTSMAYMFANMSFNQSLDSWDIGNVENISYLFFNNQVFDLSFVNLWNTSRVTHMNGTFRGASAFNQSVASWNTSRVVSMVDTFRDAISYNQPISQTYSNDTFFWFTDNVVDASGLFDGATSFTNGVEEEFLNLRFPMATTVRAMFRKTRYNKSVGFLNNMPNLVDVSYLFAENTAFNDYTIVQVFANSNIVNFSHMFDGASAFNQPLNWSLTVELHPTIDLSYMFRGATSFQSSLTFNVDNLNHTTVYLNSMFEGATLFNNNFFVYPAKNPPTECYLDLTAMFKNAVLYNRIFFSATDNIGVNILSTASMYEGASSYNQPLIGMQNSFANNPNNPYLLDMSSMFRNATSFNQPFQFVIPTVRYMAHMLDNTGLSRQNYGNILRFWSQQPRLLSRVTLGAEGLVYDISFLPFRTILTSQYQWTIVGDQGNSGSSPLIPPPFYTQNVTGGNDPTISRATRYSQLVRGKGRTVIIGLNI